MPDTQDLLSLLQQVGEEPGVERTVETVEEPEPAPEPILPEAPSEPEPVDPEAELYAQINISGLRKHRPDLIQAISKAEVKKAPKVRQPRTPKGKDPEQDFINYYNSALGMLQADPATVSGRRLTNLAKKYVGALQSAGVVLPAETTIQFVINGAQIDSVWAGEPPTGVPDALKV